MKDKWLDDYSNKEIVDLFKNNRDKIKEISVVENIQLDYEKDIFVFLSVVDNTVTLEDWNTNFRKEIPLENIGNDLSLDISNIDFEDVVDTSVLPNTLEFIGMDLY